MKRNENKNYKKQTKRKIKMITIKKMKIKE